MTTIQEGTVTPSSAPLNELGVARPTRSWVDTILAELDAVLEELGTLESSATPASGTARG